MDKQENIKAVIDEVQPSYERKLALLFLLAMPKTTEKRVVMAAKETMTKHGITDRDNMRLGIVMGLLSASLRECARQASGGKPVDLAEMLNLEAMMKRRES